MRLLPYPVRRHEHKARRRMSAHVNPDVPVTVWLDRDTFKVWNAQAERLGTSVADLLHKMASHQIVRTEPKSAGRRLSPAEVDRMWAMLDAGVPQERVAWALGISRGAVIQRKRRAEQLGHR
jgi:hypothetical protein